MFLIMHIDSLIPFYQWLSGSLWYLQYISTEYITVLQLTIYLYLLVIHFYLYVTEGMLQHRMISTMAWLHVQIERELGD